MKPYVEIKAERRTGWLSAGLGLFMAILGFVVLIDFIADRFTTALIAATFGIIVALLLPERIAMRR
ncbi:MAG TPA: hypothetical protein PKD26_15780 [Pyrinomonadaceae bacterium]|nr:hypothetical protein [Pyrinomonadaceae bacterium]